eukprot:Hpha_TRINITY_DN16326_c2_g2::TRINITY_DN16326_c2_g2_i2::g.60228::m.60228
MIGGGKGYENGKGGGHQHLHPCVVQYGDCNFGTDCRFAQVDGRICAKFLKGNCAWGASCRWKHAHPAEGVAPAPRRRQGSGTSPTRGMRGWEEENQWLAGGGGGEEADQLLSQMQGGLPLASPLAGGLLRVLCFAKYPQPYPIWRQGLVCKIVTTAVCGSVVHR